MYEEASNSSVLMLLHTAVYPFLAALIISVIAAKLLRASSYLGYIGGFITGLSLIHSGLSFPPAQAIDYYSITALIGTVSVLCFTNTRQTIPRNILGLVLFGLSFYLLLNPVLKHTGLLLSLSWAATSAIVTLVYHLLQVQPKELELGNDKAERKLSVLLPTLGLMIVAGAAAPVISIGGSLLIGQLLGALGAALFAYVIVSYLTQTTQAFSNIPASLLLGGLLTQSHVLADIPLSVMLLITASAFVTPIALKLISGVSHKQIIAVIALQGVISLLVSGFCLWLIWPESSLY